MSWMDIIHKAKTVSGTASKTGNRLAPSDLVTGLPSQVVPQIDKKREQAMRADENLRANLDARMKQVNAEIKSKQLEIDNEKQGQNNQLKLNRLGKDMNILRQKASKIQQQVRMDSGKKQRQAAGLSNNVKQILQNQGTKTPVQSVKDVELPPRNVALPSVQGTTPTQDPLVGFAQERGLMPQTTQNVPRPMGNVGLPRPDYMLPRDSQGNVIPQSPPMRDVPLPNQENLDQVGRITDKANELGLNREQMQQVVEQAKEQALPPSQRTGPPPKRKTTAQLNQEAQQRKLQQSNNPPPPPSDAQGNPIPPKEMPSINQQLIQQNKKMNERYLRELRRTATTPRQRKKEAKRQKQQAKQQARQQKTQQRLAAQRQRDAEKEAQRQAKQNPRAGGQLVRRNPNSTNPNTRLVPKGQANTQSRLRPRQPRQFPLAKSDELSKSIKDILRR